MALFEEIQKEISELLKRNGSANVTELADYFKVSAVTIRKHLDLISKKESIKRVRGGAIYITDSNISEPIYDSKRKKNIVQKKKIGIRASVLIKNNESIMIDSGSTTWYIAKEISQKKNITVITSDLKIALYLAENTDFDVHITGGTVRSGIFSSLGHRAEDYIRSIHVDKLFLSADAIDINKGITDANQFESFLKSAMIASAEKVILVTDSSKFNKISLSTVGGLKNINRLITDSGIPEKYLEYFNNNNIEVDIV